MQMIRYDSFFRTMSNIYDEVFSENRNLLKDAIFAKRFILVILQISKYPSEMHWHLVILSLKMYSRSFLISACQQTYQKNLKKSWNLLKIWKVFQHLFMSEIYYRSCCLCKHFKVILSEIFFVAYTSLLDVLQKV